MPKMISDLPSAVSISDADVVAVEQAGVSKKITWASLRSAVAFEFGQPKKDDLLVMTGSGFRAKSEQRWRIVPQAAYISTGVTSMMVTFPGGAPASGIKRKATDYFAVGDVVRVQVNGIFYYGMCKAVTDTTLTTTGARIPGGSSIQQLAIGSRSMLRSLTLRVDGTGYATSTSLPLTKGCRHRWQGKTGHLFAVFATHMNTSTTIQVSSEINGVDVMTFPMFAGTATTYGNWAGNDTLQISDAAAKAEITDGDLITVKSVVIGGSADWPIFQLYFVVP